MVNGGQGMPNGFDTAAAAEHVDNESPGLRAPKMESLFQKPSTVGFCVGGDPKKKIEVSAKAKARLAKIFNDSSDEKN